MTTQFCEGTRRQQWEEHTLNRDTKTKDDNEYVMIHEAKFCRKNQDSSSKRKSKNYLKNLVKNRKKSGHSSAKAVDKILQICCKKMEKSRRNITEALKESLKKLKKSDSEQKKHLKTTLVIKKLYIYIYI